MEVIANNEVRPHKKYDENDNEPRSDEHNASTSFLKIEDESLGDLGCSLPHSQSDFDETEEESRRFSKFSNETYDRSVSELHEEQEVGQPDEVRDKSDSLESPAQDPKLVATKSQEDLELNDTVEIPSDESNVEEQNTNHQPMDDFKSQLSALVESFKGESLSDQQIDDTVSEVLKGTLNLKKPYFQITNVLHNCGSELIINTPSVSNLEKPTQNLVMPIGKSRSFDFESYPEWDISTPTTGFDIFKAEYTPDNVTIFSGQSSKPDLSSLPSFNDLSASADELINLKIQFYNIVHDVTERSAMVKASLVAMKKFSSFLENAMDNMGILETDIANLRELVASIPEGTPISPKSASTEYSQLKKSVSMKPRPSLEVNPLPKIISADLEKTPQPKQEPAETHTAAVIPPAPVQPKKQAVIKKPPQPEKPPSQKSPPKPTFKFLHQPRSFGTPTNPRSTIPKPSVLPRIPAVTRKLSTPGGKPSPQTKALNQSVSNKSSGIEKPSAIKANPKFAHIGSTIPKPGSAGSCRLSCSPSTPKGRAGLNASTASTPGSGEKQPSSVKKNAKYAHIGSTIPKPSAIARVKKQC